MTFSIITPTFNSRTTLAATIESVLSQDGVMLEYLIVDGGSTDGTVDLIRGYADGDPRIRWVSEPDRGIADAFNKGIGMATGEWIGIINSDDRYAPGALAAVAEAARRNPAADVIHGDMLRIDEEGKPLFVLKPADLEQMIWRQMPINHPTTFVARQTYSQLGLFDKSLKVAMDYELALRFFLNGKKFCYVDQVLALMSYGGVSDARLMDVRCEVYSVSVRYGYPRAKAAFWMVDNLLRGWLKMIMRRAGMHALLRLHPRFHKVS